VIREADGAVAGVVSGRYYNADGSLAGTVWVARAEDLAVLLNGVAEITMRRVPLAGPVDVLLTIDTERVRLSAGPTGISASHGGVRPGLAEAVNEARRSRAHIGQVLDPDRTRPGTPPPDAPSIEGLAARGSWYFVGRRAEAGRTDLPWRDRLGILRAHVLDRVPVLLLLDNFEDNLRPDGDAGYAVRDEVLAELLAAWVTDPGRSRLLITCRYPFTLPGGAADRLSFRQLGALSRAETMKLAWSLPALDDLDEAQLEQAWRLAGGHPRSLEYLDALLSGGQASYPDVTKRLNDAVTRRLVGADRTQWLAARTGLDAALAETVALAADDVLLDELLARLDQVPGAVALLTGVSVYREPVDVNAVLFRVGQSDPDAEHLPDRKAARQQIIEILSAAGIVVDDSFDLASLWPQDRATDVHDLLEARHHLLQAGDTEAAGQVTELAVSQLHTWGAWDQEAALIHDTLAQLPTGSPRHAAWLHQLGLIAHVRGDYEEAARQFQRSLDINERLGNQVGVATAASQLGNLEADRGGSTVMAMAWHVKVLLIRVRLGVPQARNNLRRLSGFRRELGTGPFTSVLAETVADTELAQMITSRLDEWDNADDSTD
jgi:tetratricopeptide (TPR) repeat protein